MTWREKLTARILLMVAKMIAPDAMKEEIKTLATHIHVAILEQK